MSGIQARGAYFLIRHHAGTKLHPLGRESSRRRHPDGTISEQRVRVGMLECRCIIIRLKQPLRDGTTEIRLLTNVPPGRLSARRASELYRTRWRIESAFQELTESLRCEIDTLGYPRAALFGFGLGGGGRQRRGAVELPHGDAGGGGGRGPVDRRAAVGMGPVRGDDRGGVRRLVGRCGAGHRLATVPQATARPEEAGGGEADTAGCPPIDST